jgi:hypothetical protein
MLEHSKLARQVIGSTGHTEVLKPINTQSVARWEREMTTFDKRMANRLIGETLNKLGYPTVGHDSLSIWEHAKLFLLGVRYQFLNFFRAVLYELGFLTLNRRKQQKGKRKRRD